MITIRQIVWEINAVGKSFVIGMVLLVSTKCFVSAPAAVPILNVGAAGFTKAYHLATLPVKSSPATLPLDTSAEQLQAAHAAYQQGDYVIAAKDLFPLAKKGNPLAQFGLGLLYDQGHGVAQNYAKAVDWYRLAARQGNLLAQDNLGHLYFLGHGVAMDAAKAAYWWSLSAKQGDASAQASLGLLYLSGISVPQDIVKAAYWFGQAAKQGDALAQSSLGSLYYHGHGVPQDYIEAYKWFDLTAAHLPPGPAQRETARQRDLVAAKLTSAQLVKAQALAETWRPHK